MPISVSCPTCQARLTAPDAAAGRRVKCAGCQSVITVPLAAPVADHGFDVVEDPPAAGHGFEVVEPPADRPAVARKVTPVKPVRRPAADDDDDDRPRRRRGDEDDRPRGRRPNRADDEDDDRPATPKRSKLPLILAGAAVLMLFVCGGGLTGLYYLIRPRDDQPRFPGQQPWSVSNIGGASWVKLDGPDLPFVAQFPNGPGVKTDPFATVTDPNLRKMAESLGQTDYWVREDGGRTYSLLVRVYPDGLVPPAGMGSRVLDGASQAYVMMSPGATEADSSTGSWKGAPFKQLTVNLPDGKTNLVRQIYLKGTLYQLVVQGGAGLGAGDKTAGEFFDSFEPKPKDRPEPASPKSERPESSQKTSPSPPQTPKGTTPKKKRP